MAAASFESRVPPAGNSVPPAVATDDGMRGSSSCFPAWAHSVSDTCAFLKVDPAAGLSEDQVRLRRQDSGWNELQSQPSTPFWMLVLQQFDDTLVKILLFAAAVSFLLAYLDAQVPFMSSVVGLFAFSGALYALRCLLHVFSGALLVCISLVPEHEHREAA